MILYHGSRSDFDKFDLSYAKPGKDFGKGIYLTSSYEQARKWACKLGNGFIYKCEFDESIIDSDNSLKIRALTNYDKEWLDFICQSRINLKETDDDLVYDRMADNNFKELSKALRLYANGKRSAFYTIQRIRWSSVLNDQYCFKTEASLKYLHIVSKKEVHQ